MSPNGAGTVRRRYTRAAIAVLVLGLVAVSVFYFVYLPLNACPSASAEGYAFYVKVVSDAPTDSPVSGASVRASYLSSCVTGRGATTKTVSIRLPTLTTPASGVVMVSPAYGGSYSVSVDYGGHTYGFQAYVRPVTMTNLTLSLPSGTWNETYTNE